MSSDSTATTTSFVHYDTSSSELRDAAISKATLRSYDNNLNKFLTFTRLTLSELQQLPFTIIDQRLSEYIDHLFARKGSYDYISFLHLYLIHGLATTL